MPMPSADSAASAIVAANQLTGRHVLHVEGYSHTKALVNGYHLVSQPFDVGGRAWCIWYYPHGTIYRQGIRDNPYISVYLVLADGNPEPAYAEATFHVLGQAENPVPAHSRSTGLCRYWAEIIRHGFPDFISSEFLEASEYLVDECYKIRCDVTVWKGCATESKPDPPPPPPDLHRHLGDLLVSKEGADVTFHVEGRTFSAHKSVVAARSPVLKAMLFGTAAADDDAAGACVRVDGVVPPVFEALLHFVYTDSLPEVVTGRWQYEAAMDLELLVAASRFGMQRLMPICEERLCRHIKVDTAAGFLLLAHQFGCHRLREACVEFLKCPRALNAAMATDGFERLVKRCPALLKDMISMLAAR